MSIKENNFEIMKNNQNDLRELEQFYTNNKVDNLLAIIEEKKENITNEIIEYADNLQVPCKWNVDGDVVAYKTKINPLVISNYFFKSIINVNCNEPEYNAEKLSLVFDYYCHILAEVNDKIGNYPSSITSFCKLAGITSNTLRSYRNSSDYSMRVISEKIYDQIGDENITMSQMGAVNERTTVFKMKSQNEMIEKQQPTVHISITEKPDVEQIANKINKYKEFANKKGK